MHTCLVVWKRTFQRSRGGCVAFLDCEFLCERLQVCQSSHSTKGSKNARNSAFAFYEGGSNCSLKHQHYTHNTAELKTVSREHFSFQCCSRTSTLKMSKNPNIRYPAIHRQIIFKCWTYLRSTDGSLTAAKQLSLL